MTTADAQPKDGNEPGNASGTQEVIEAFGALSEPQFQHIGQLLGERLGRYKDWSTHRAFGPTTTETAGAVCAYLRDQAITHHRETTTRWSPLTGSADQPPAAAAQPGRVEGRAMDDYRQRGNAPPRAFTAAAGTGTGPDVHVLVYSHRRGDDITVHHSIAQARAALAGIAREWWHEITGYDGVPPSPDGLTDDQAIETYFGRQEDERYQIAAARVPQPVAGGQVHGDADGLLAWAEGIGLGSGQLDELIHDAVSKQASEINNGGLAAQIQFLAGTYGAGGARSLLGGVAVPAAAPGTAEAGVAAHDGIRPGGAGHDSREG